MRIYPSSQKLNKFVSNFSDSLLSIIFIKKIISANVLLVLLNLLIDLNLFFYFLRKAFRIS